MKPYASCYDGHQFGNWAGQLGDSRAINPGEVTTKNELFTLQLKGTGMTPYSRQADGQEHYDHLYASISAAKPCTTSEYPPPEHSACALLANLLPGICFITATLNRSLALSCAV